MELNDLEKIDKKSMFKTYDIWPDIARESFEKKFEKLDVKDIDHVVFAGMGGSGSIGDAINTILSKKDIHVSNVKGYLLPKTVDSKTLVIVTSVSGNTSETLAILNNAKQTTAKIVGFSSGGKIERYCKKNEIAWFASAWDTNSQESLRQFDCQYNIVASAMIVHQDLLNMIAEEGKHTFISTGMTEYADIQKAIDIFKAANCPFELMHTVSTYPMKDEDANLNMIKTLREKFNCDVGYSGHEVGLAVSYAAAALDITSLERHITLDRAMYGSDQSASIEPSGLRQLVGAVRKIEQAMGNGEKQIVDAEVPIAQKLREHLDWKANH